MKFNAHGVMQSCPRFTTEVKAGPLDFESDAGAKIEGAVSAIDASIGEIPIRLAIPFKKRGNKMPVVASIGGFKFKLNPFGIKIEVADVKIKGVLGTKGIEAKADTHVTCKTDMKVKGNLAGKTGVVEIDFGEDDFDFDEPECK